MECFNKLSAILRVNDSRESKALLRLSDPYINRSIWMIGVDWWAYNIGYGGLYHILASGKNENILVLDMEVYSNIGDQVSKTTPTDAVVSLASNGKSMPKENLGILAITFRNGIFCRNQSVLRIHMYVKSPWWWVI